MPLYTYRCTKGCIATDGQLYTWDEFRHGFDGREISVCPLCKKDATRAHDKEVPIFRPDITPHFNYSLGAYVKSRSDIRDNLAFHNASMDLPTGSYPSAGRLCDEERSELVKVGADTFGESKVRGWGDVAAQKEAEGSGMTVEGKADYQWNRNAVRSQTKNKGGEA